MPTTVGNGCSSALPPFSHSSLHGLWLARPTPRGSRSPHGQAAVLFWADDGGREFPTEFAGAAAEFGPGRGGSISESACLFDVRRVKDCSPHQGWTPWTFECERSCHARLSYFPIHPDRAFPSLLTTKLGRNFAASFRASLAPVRTLWPAGYGFSGMSLKRRAWGECWILDAQFPWRDCLFSWAGRSMHRQEIIQDIPRRRHEGASALLVVFRLAPHHGSPTGPAEPRFEALG